MSATPVASALAAAGADPKLDELMLAMDVVDTLRHEQALAEKELREPDRDEVLKARLRRIYEGQGLHVSDRILDDGIRALKESRFIYTPPPRSIGRTMATLWVRRAAVAKLLGVVVLLLLALATWQGWREYSAEQRQQQARTELTITLPSALIAAGQAALDEAKVEPARITARKLLADGRAALAAGNAAGARKAIAGLGILRARLVQQYVLRIISRPGEQSGAFRIPDVNQGARNYYLIVEAVSPDGTVLSMPVVNEENGKTETATKWGIRVPQSTFEAVRRDKNDDGIIQNNKLAEKRRGELDPTYLMPVLQGTIARW